MSDVVFSEPPPKTGATTRGQSRYQAFFDAIRERPGEWAEWPRTTTTQARRTSPSLGRCPTRVRPADRDLDGRRTAHSRAARSCALGGRAVTAPRKFVRLACPRCGFTTSAPASATEVTHGTCPAAKGKRVALVAVESEAVDA